MNPSSYAATRLRPDAAPGMRPGRERDPARAKQTSPLNLASGSCRRSAPRLRRESAFFRWTAQARVVDRDDRAQSGRPARARERSRPREVRRVEGASRVPLGVAGRVLALQEAVQQLDLLRAARRALHE